MEKKQTSEKSYLILIEGVILIIAALLAFITKKGGIAFWYFVGIPSIIVAIVLGIFIIIKLLNKK